MKINGMGAKHIGLVGFGRPWEATEMEMFDDIWGTPDGKRYVERYVQADVVEYDWLKHGYIWTNDYCDKMEKELNLKWFDPCSCCPYGGYGGIECQNCTCEGFYVKDQSKGE